jgi:hypothetical protein
MAKRKLRIVRETPRLGVCENCNMQFSGVTALGAPYIAAVQEQFDAHKCKPMDSSQNALRVVREATEDK